MDALTEDLRDYVNEWTHANTGFNGGGFFPLSFHTTRDVTGERLQNSIIVEVDDEAFTDDGEPKPPWPGQVLYAEGRRRLYIVAVPLPPVRL